MAEVASRASVSRRGRVMSRRHSRASVTRLFPFVMMLFVGFVLVVLLRFVFVMLAVPMVVVALVATVVALLVSGSAIVMAVGENLWSAH